MITLEGSENRNLHVGEAVRRRKQQSESHAAQYYRHEKLFRSGTAWDPDLAWYGFGMASWSEEPFEMHRAAMSESG